jgi:hypothetical protein
VSKPALLLVVCGAPLAFRLGDGVRAARGRGWDPYVIPTDAALPWLAEQDLADAPVIVGNRKPTEPRRTPTADAVVVVPTTFHTLNAWATGNAFSYPLTTLCAALGSQTQTVAVPYASQELTNHPAWSASIAVLRQAGIQIVDPQNGSSESLAPVPSGTGGRIVRDFRWDWVFERITPTPKV